MICGFVGPTSVWMNTRPGNRGVEYIATIVDQLKTGHLFVLNIIDFFGIENSTN